MSVGGTRATPELTGSSIPAANAGLGWITLLASGTTLICCALPIGLVMLGFGAAVAALTSTFPALVVLSANKAWLFGGSGVLMAATAWTLWRPGRACPAEQVLAARCERAMQWNRRLLLASAGVWAIGFFAAYLALPIRIWLGI